jgi:ribonuclease HI
MVQIYTDGSCKSNGNTNALGGTGVVVLKGEEVIHTHRETFSQTTNNRMEYRAMIYAFEWCIEHQIESPRFFSDSQLLLNTITQWMYGWEKKGWRKSGTGESSKIKNLDLVLRLWELKPRLKNPTFEWVKGHSENLFNQMADDLTNELEPEHGLQDSTDNEILKKYHVIANMAVRGGE